MGSGSPAGRIAAINSNVDPSDVRAVRALFDAAAADPDPGVRRCALNYVQCTDPTALGAIGDGPSRDLLLSRPGPPAPQPPPAPPKPPAGDEDF